MLLCSFLLWSLTSAQRIFRSKARPAATSLQNPPRLPDASDTACSFHMQTMGHCFNSKIVCVRFVEPVAKHKIYTILHIQSYSAKKTVWLHNLLQPNLCPKWCWKSASVANRNRAAPTAIWGVALPRIKGPFLAQLPTGSGPLAARTGW